MHLACQWPAARGLRQVRRQGTAHRRAAELEGTAAEGEPDGEGVAMKTVLLVTWFYLNQQPVISQTVFDTEEACGRARVAVLMDAERLKKEALPPPPGYQATVPSYPTVSVVCSPLQEDPTHRHTSLLRVTNFIVRVFPTERLARIDNPLPLLFAG